MTDQQNTSETVESPDEVARRLQRHCYDAYRERGWHFQWEPGTQFVSANHPLGGKQSVCEVVAMERNGWDRNAVGTAIAALLNRETVATAAACYVNPETEETFDGQFSTDGMDAQMIAARIDEEITECRKAAGDFVRGLFLRHNYFNGRMKGNVNHDTDEHVITCSVTVRCYGLPVIVCEADRASYLEGTETGSGRAGETKPFSGVTPSSAAAR